MWGKELKDFAALKALRAAHADDNDFIAAVENYTLPKEWENLELHGII